MKKIHLLVLTRLLLAGAVIVALAQTNRSIAAPGEPSSPVEAGAETDRLLETETGDENIDERIDQIRTLRAKIEGLTALAGSATELERLAIARKIEKTQIRLVELAHDVAGHALDEKDDSIRERASEFANEILVKFPKPLLEHIDDIDRQVSMVSVRIAEAESVAAELDAIHELEALLDRGDRLYALTTKQIDLMESVGLPTRRVTDELTTRLVRRAELLSAYIALAQDDRERFKDRLAAGEDDAAKGELAAVDGRLEAFVASLGSNIDAMKARELKTAEYQEVLIGATGALDAKSLDAGVLWSMLGKWIAQARTMISENGLNVVVKILVFMALIVAFRFLASVMRKLVSRAIDGSKLNISALLRDMLIRVTGSTVMIIGILVALSQLGVSVGPLLAGLGIAGFILGFALQDTLSNFASGMMILLYRPFDVGDVVEAGGVAGSVSRMNLVSTTILTFDHQTLVVPNSKIWGDVIRNVTAQPTRRVDMTFGIGYGDDIAHAESVLREIVEKHEKVLSDPAPVVELHKLGESSVDFVVRPWAKSGDYWRVYWDVTRAVKERFDTEGISIPFPQRDLHLFNETGEPLTKAASQAEERGRRSAEAS